MADTATAPKTSETGDIYSVETPVQEHALDLYHYDAFPEYVNRLDDVTDAHIRRFHDQGYLAIRHAFAPDEIEAAARAVWDLIDGIRDDFKSIQVEAAAREKFKTLGRAERRAAVRKIFRFIDYDPRLKALAEHPGILSLLTRIMGAPPELFQDMGLMKPARIGREKPWHQDAAYFNIPPDTTVVGVWIALDEATPENGCLHIIPGSHREGPRPHFKRRDWQICDTDIATHRDVMVPLPPGGCLLWHGLTHHGSPGNRSPERRRALQFHYQPAGTQNIAVQERMGIYGGEGLGIEC